MTNEAKRSEESVSTDWLDGWEIRPCIDGEHDSTFILIEQDPDAEYSYDLLYETIEELWMDAKLETMNISVSLKRTKIHKDDYAPNGDIV